ncbi:Solute carrier organic anion transporter family member 5A1 [Nibea albiflora]|uniref:Solute carrier organic anion transporter family member 5A1 n=1 Tax=Nibea albiflora TaxID=240163 RepID=A0ACB7FH05_NIBAL|nr:Solute carrier organic anion transporter family member 5A1 [Nibea albiflora]
MGNVVSSVFLSSLPLFCTQLTSRHPSTLAPSSDTTCMLWQQDCGVHGSCWEYDVTLPALRLLRPRASLKFLGFLFIFLTWYSIKYKEERVERWLKRHLSPVDTVGSLCLPPGRGHKGHARTRSCPVNIREPTPTLCPPTPRSAPAALNRGVSHPECPGNELKAITPPPPATPTPAAPPTPPAPSRSLEHVSVRV